MSKKIDRAAHGPGWAEVILGAVLSIVLGVVLGAVVLIIRPVVVAKELPKEPDPNSLTVEAAKLQSLRSALWDAFEAGPDGGLPNTLIDLTIAYTNALRLQLNLKSMASRQAVPPRAATGGARRDGTVKT